ncbi:MAG TPA: Fe(2+)-trafficking protein [Tepidisphaeraceae bacterium]|jgi:Fe-S cluster biosynthesis and repair protein YggX|nr:Fe(2+)-trafficking protein [Tepidisphaeraceae bacterium]
MADSARIEQFRKMANDDPNNELGHFSLGRALLESGDYQNSIASFDRVIELNKNISKVYQLKASALLKLERKDEAIETLKAGARIASERGDLMPKNEMLRMLGEMGIEMPELQQKASPQQQVGEGQVICHRCGQVKARMAHPPFSNAQGKMIQEKICADCWREWIGMGTKVINELRLPLSDPQAQKLFEQHMLEFLNLQ